jgi:hypothetical protein
MSIGLVTYIPNNTVLWCIEDIMKGYGQFHHAKTGGQMAWVDRQLLYDIFSQFPAQLWQ